MDFVTSADGTRIGYEISGTGSPIVLVGGACYGAKAWAAVAGFLAPHHTVYAVDRRGRGASELASGDSDAYAVEREIEDIRAVLDEIGEPVELFGHSSGGLLSLRVAQSGASVSRMTLYEPPLRVPGGATADGITPRLVEALAEEDREQALTMFLVEADGGPQPVRKLTVLRRPAEGGGGGHHDRGGADDHDDGADHRVRALVRHPARRDAFVDDI